MFTLEYENDVGPEDAYFKEWWTVLEDGREICRADTEADAKRIVAALEAFPRPTP